MRNASICRSRAASSPHFGAPQTRRKRADKQIFIGGAQYIIRSSCNTRHCRHPATRRARRSRPTTCVPQSPPCHARGIVATALGADRPPVAVGEMLAEKSMKHQLSAIFFHPPRRQSAVATMPSRQHANGSASCLATSRTSRLHTFPMSKTPLSSCQNATSKK